MEKGFEKDVFTRRDFLKVSGLSLGALTLGPFRNGSVAFAAAKDIFPSDTVTCVVPHKPGGAYDVLARAIGPYLSKYLREGSPQAKGGDVQVRNEPAASGRKGYSLLARSKPNGYTIGICDITPITDSIFEPMEIDFTKFTFLWLPSSPTKVLITSKKGFASWNEAVNSMKKEPVKISTGSMGRSLHIAAIMATEKMKLNARLIPFPGQAESLNALIRGDVKMAMVSEDAIQGLIEAGEVKPLLIFDDVSTYPEAVSVKDIGYPDLPDQFANHRFIIGPPALETNAKNALIGAMKKVMVDAEFSAWARKMKFPLKNVFGADAEKVFLKYKKTFEDMTPILKKYLG
jgi:tripartite-type tricarboxylate transporter receptor subunit TctC